MRLLLDTHVVLWWLGEPERLTRQARTAIAEETNDVLVSAATVWEAGIKAALGKLRGADDLAQRILEQRLGELPITFAHAEIAAALPGHHDDPFDRLLVAQAQSEGLTLVTQDGRLAAYDVAILAA